MPVSTYTAIMAYEWPTIGRLGSLDNVPTLRRKIKIKVPDIGWIASLCTYADGNLKLISIKSQNPLDNVEEFFNNLNVPKADTFVEGFNRHDEQPRMARVYFTDGAVVNFPLGEQWHDDLMVGKEVGPLLQKKRIKAIHMDGERRPL